MLMIRNVNSLRHGGSRGGRSEGARHPFIPNFHKLSTRTDAKLSRSKTDGFARSCTVRKLVGLVSLAGRHGFLISLAWRMDCGGQCEGCPLGETGFNPIRRSNANMSRAGWNSE